MSDLDRALELTKGKKSRARALALCQRGVLLRKRGKDDDARAAFTEAAKLGSSFARKQVRLCRRYLRVVHFYMKAQKRSVMFFLVGCRGQFFVQYYPNTLSLYFSDMYRIYYA